MPRISPLMTARARRLRNEATNEERMLWERLRQHRPRFTRQLPVGPYVIDLACRSARLAIEIDGSQHIAGAAADEKRSEFLRTLGWTVLRFWNSEVRSNPDGVAEAIVAALAACQQSTHPRPLPFREGS